MLENNVQKGTDPSLNLEQVHQNYKKLTEFLIKNSLTITTMESCTSGFIASLITDTEGSSAVIKGACVTYSNQAKIANGVRPQIIEEFGVYSVQTAQEMAEAVLKIYPSSISLGVTGTFGNVDPNNKDSIPGKVYFAVSINSKMILRELSLPINISRFQSKLFVANQIFTVLAEELKIE